MRQLLAGLLLSLTLTACGDAGGDRVATEASAEASTSRAAKASPSPSPSPLARVSLATACPELFEHQQSAQQLVGEFVGDAQALADAGAATTARFDDVLADLEYDSTIAPIELVPFIDAQIRTLEGLRSYLQVGGNTTTDFRDYRASGQELLNQCRPYL